MMKNKQFFTHHFSVLTYLLCLILVTQSFEANAKNNKVFTIAKFAVEAQAKNAVEAKQLAIAEGQKAAFRMLIKRLTNFSSYDRIASITPSSVSTLLDGFSVRRERNSRVRYIALLDFNFRAQLIRDLLRSNNIPFMEKQSKPIVLLPIILTENVQGVDTTNVTRLEQTLSESDKRNLKYWRGSWALLDLLHTLTPIELATPYSDITPSLIETILLQDKIAFQELQSGYLETHNKKYFMIAVAQLDQAQQLIKVTLIGEDEPGEIFLEKKYKILNNDVRGAFQKAAQVSMRIIESRWKLVRSSIMGEELLSAAPENFVVTVEFSNIREWQNIRSKITDIPGVDQLQVGSLSARAAEIRLNYPGGATQFSRQVSAFEMLLENKGGAWILRAL